MSFSHLYLGFVPNSPRLRPLLCMHTSPRINLWSLRGRKRPGQRSSFCLSSRLIWLCTLVSCQVERWNSYLTWALCFLFHGAADLPPHPAKYLGVRSHLSSSLPWPEPLSSLVAWCSTSTLKAHQCTVSDWLLVTGVHLPESFYNACSF